MKLNTVQCKGNPHNSHGRVIIIHLLSLRLLHNSRSLPPPLQKHSQPPTPPPLSPPSHLAICSILSPRSNLNTVHATSGWETRLRFSMTTVCFESSVQSWSSPTLAPKGSLKKIHTLQEQWEWTTCWKRMNAKYEKSRKIKQRLISFPPAMSTTYNGPLLLP